MKKVILFIFIFGLSNLINAADVKVGSEVEQSEEEKASEFDKQYPAFKLAGVKLENISDEQLANLGNFLAARQLALKFSESAFNYSRFASDSADYYVKLDDKLRKLADHIREIAAAASDNASSQKIYNDYINLIYK